MFFIEGWSYDVGALRAAALSDAQATSCPIEAVVDELTSMTVGRTRILTPSGGDSRRPRYRFNYVGVVVCHDYLFAVMPKYYARMDDQSSQDHEIAVMGEVLKAVRRYQGRHGKRRTVDGRSFIPADAHEQDDHLELYRYLLEDYAQNGPYRSPRRIHEIDGGGDVDWERTVGITMPVMSRRVPAYMTTVNSRRTRESHNVIARLQAAILTEITDAMERTHLTDLLHLPSLRISHETIDDLGGTEYAVRMVRRERRTQFETRKRLLLDCMLDYLEGDGAPTEARRTLFEGTTAFNLVWEDVCRTVLGGWNTDNDYMPHPCWRYRPDGDVMPMVEDFDANFGADCGDGGDVSVDSDTLIPDVISTVRDDGISRQYVLDAKYYVPTWGVKRDGLNTRGLLSHAPRVGDVIKQYFYLMAIEHLDRRTCGRLGLEWPVVVSGNAFVLPKRLDHAGVSATGYGDDDGRGLLRYRGLVNFAFMRAYLSLPDRYAHDTEEAGDSVDSHGLRYRDVVMVYEMDPERAISMYLRGVSRDMSERLVRSMFPQGGVTLGSERVMA